MAAAVNCLDTEPASKTVSARVGDAVLEVGRAVGAGQDLLAVLADADRAARRVGLVAREDGVHARREVGRGWIRGGFGAGGATRGPRGTPPLVSPMPSRA